MRKTVRIISILLSVILIITMFAVPASAASGLKNAKLLKAGNSVTMSAASNNKTYIYKINLNDSGKMSFFKSGSKTSAKTKMYLLDSNGKTLVSKTFKDFVKTTLKFSKKGTYYLKINLKKNQSVSGFGYKFTANNDDFIIEDGILIKYNGKDGDVVIPQGVKSIGDRAFSGGAFDNNTTLTSITIPNSVTSIGAYAFAFCTSLTSINIPDSVTSIGESAFYYCKALASINIPDSVTSIGNTAFYYCENLKSIIIPNSLTIIEDSMFNSCSGLTSITIPNSVTSIECSAFQSCTNLTSVNIPDSVTYIGLSAFENCEKLKSIIIPKGVTAISLSAFQNCYNLTSVTIPNTVTSIERCAFVRCNNLTNLTIPDSVTSIGKYSFDECKKLTIKYKGKKYTLNSFDKLYND